METAPTFAPAYGGLAEAYCWSTAMGLLPSQFALPKAEEAAKKALEIDPSLGMAHHSLAWVNFAYKWDFPAAEKEFHRAIERNANNATSHLWYGMFLAWQGRPQESLAEMQRAKQLDPFSSITNGLAMTPLLTSHQYNQLIDSAGEALKSSPNDPLLLWLLATAYEWQGNLVKAVDLQQQQAILFGGDLQKTNQEFAAVRRDIADHGEGAYWRNREKSAAHSGDDPYNMAVVQAHLDESKEMYASLERAYTTRSNYLVYTIKTEPAFDRFRSEEPFRNLVQKIGFEP